MDLLIRRSQPSEHEAVKALVQMVVDETYAGLWAAPPLPIGDEDWSMASVALLEDALPGDALVGMVLTNAAWIDDLWVLREYRGRGIGKLLLEHAEAEIAARGSDVMRLRVVKSNTNAVRFYERYGWHVERELLHETFSIAMLEMQKACRAE
ncbi:GNAT family N-acetyltransferase [Granulicella arctica]|uniref:GNAT family N-acetyltransferase n=1 Tax=Granulicella arctica TaxID=940613 RepID=UPI0021DF4A2A|nr:GNAT family N-acetyltransferase [Granulicella arctica]